MSSNPFGNLSVENTEKVEDRIGGNFSALESDIYSGKIKVAYAGESTGGARSLTVIASGGDFGDREYRETIYLTSGRDKGQSNTYERDGKKYQLPGFIVANHIAQCAVGKTVMELAFEEKKVNVYDPEQKKELPKSVMVATELTGADISLAILKSTESQTEKNQQGQYVPKSDGSTRDVNNIDKVFNTAYKMTVHEAESKQKDPSFEPEFWNKWLEKNKGETRDKTSKTGGNGAVQNGRPGGGAPTGNGGAPAGGGAEAPRKSLFGN